MALHYLIFIVLKLLRKQIQTSFSEKLIKCQEIIEKYQNVTRDFMNKVLPTSKQTKHLTLDNLISNLLIIALISYCVFPL